MRTSKPLILVLGAGGQVGRCVLQQLARFPDELRVRVTARAPDKVSALRAEGQDAVLLDLDRPSTFAAALRGVDRVFLLTAYTIAMLAQSKTFVDAARKASVQHIVIWARSVHGTAQILTLHGISLWRPILGVVHRLDTPAPQCLHGAPRQSHTL